MNIFKPASYWAELDREEAAREVRPERFSPIRAKGREKKCPECLASPGELCRGIKGQTRKSNHKARYKGDA